LIGLIKYLHDRIPSFKGLLGQIQNPGEYPAGHYYSPIPDKKDVLAHIKSLKPLNKQMLGINLNEEKQIKILKEYKEYYKDLSFPEKKKPEFRYYYENTWFSYADAIILYSFLRKHEPNKIIEVGSGYSSAVILDTIEKYLSTSPEITFIEPYSERIRGLLKKDDENSNIIIDKNVQDVPLDIFLSLERGDLLFIDSSHVVKCASDLHFILFDILPLLHAGVFVHFHDIFYPFEYPNHWLKFGRYWNEAYFLRAFLSFNAEWNIYFFNSYASIVFFDYLKKEMPLCVKDAGSSLYIQRK
jgi:hypothetical protein